MTAIDNTCGSASTAVVTSGSMNISAGGNITGILSSSGSGSLVWIDPYPKQHSHTFSKESLDQILKEFAAGKYTRKYVEVYLDFMVMNAMLDNLEYLEYKVRLNKEEQTQ